MRRLVSVPNHDAGPCDFTNSSPDRQLSYCTLAKVVALGCRCHTLTHRRVRGALWLQYAMHVGTEHLLAHTLPSRSTPSTPSPPYSTCISDFPLFPLHFICEYVSVVVRDSPCFCFNLQPLNTLYSPC
jgi:hypothetical protein